MYEELLNNIIACVLVFGSIFGLLLWTFWEGTKEAEDLEKSGEFIKNHYGEIEPVKKDIK